MASNIISSFRTFEGSFKVPQEEKRTQALKVYFSNGGVISAVKTGAKWPKLTYPSPHRVDVQIKELEKIREEHDKKAREWKAKLSQAKSYHTRHQLMKFSDPLYWKHTAKALSDKDYREDAEKVSLPVHLVSDKRWKPMIKMFHDDIEYRKNLVETVQTSVVYKKDRKVAKYADSIQEFRTGISSSKLKESEKKISEVNAQIDALVEIRKWATE